MRHLGKLIGLSIAVAAILLPVQAQAATTMSNLVDGTVTSGSTTCSWVNATTSDNPPNTLTVFHNTVDISCNDGTELTLNNDPVISFDDAAGTATVDVIDISGTRSGITCSYRATNVTLNREGTTRTYTGGPFTGDLYSGSWFCPSSLTVDTAKTTFH